MKKLVIALIAILAIAGIGVVSCPDKQDHKDAIMALANNKLDSEINKAEIGSLGMLGSTIGSKFIGAYIDSNFSVKNHFVCSTGRLTTEEGERVVSLGVFGHVFTPSQKQFDEAVDKAIADFSL